MCPRSFAHERNASECLASVLLSEDVRPCIHPESSSSLRGCSCVWRVVNPPVVALVALVSIMNDIICLLHVIASLVCLTLWFSLRLWPWSWLCDKKIGGQIGNAGAGRRLRILDRWHCALLVSSSLHGSPLALLLLFSSMSGAEWRPYASDVLVERVLLLG